LFSKTYKAAVALLIVLVAFLITFTFVPAAYANSAEPPTLTAVVSFPPDDLELSIRFADGSTSHAFKLQKEQKAWETYFRFFRWMTEQPETFPDTFLEEGPLLTGAVLVVQSSEVNFETPLPESVLGQYNTLLTLDLASQSLTEGQSAARVPLLVSMRVILTLLVEGLIFLAFGYRTLRSWITFVAVNLVTQGALNLLFIGPDMGSYMILGLVFVEFFVLLVEMLVFVLLLKEHKKSRAVVYALVANIASLILGGVLLSFLPV